MDNSDRKMLAEWLNECWHEYDLGGFRNLEEYFMCVRGYPLCNKCNSHNIFQRTFTSPDDFFAVKNRLVDNDDWGEFTDYASDAYLAEIGRSSICDYCESFWCWLIDPTRFCQLAADFLKGRE